MSANRIVTQTAFFAPPEANKVFPMRIENADDEFNVMWVYPASGTDKNAGLLIPNVGDAFIGERTAGSIDLTPDYLDPGDGTAQGITPTPFNLPVGTTKRVKEMLVQVATLGDGVFIKWWSLSK